MPRRGIVQGRAHETRTKIVRGAASSFAENGFAGATITDIISRSGVTKGALYFHFETKAEIADAILVSHGEWLAERARDLSGEGFQPVIDLSYTMCDALASDDVFRAAARLAVERETFGGNRPQSFDIWEGLAVGLLARVNDDSIVEKPIDIVKSARIMTATLLGLHLATQATPGSTSLHDQVEFYWRCTLPGILTAEHYAGLELAHGRAS